MTRFTTANTEDFTSEELTVLNGAYDIIAATVDCDETTAYDVNIAICDGLNNAFIEGDTVETLVARFRSQHQNM